jgi:hypothetical protein
VVVEHEPHHNGKGSSPRWLTLPVPHICPSLGGRSTRKSTEDEHDGAEPHEDSDPSLGWTLTTNRTSPAWQASYLGAVDLEDGMGPVWKRRRWGATTAWA